MGNQKS